MKKKYGDDPLAMAEEIQRKNPMDMTGEVEEDGEVEDPPMDEVELQSILNQEATDAVTYIDTDLSPIRAMATQYYRGDLFGNEQDGQSKVVATEVRDTVNSMLPSIMKVFFGSERMVEYVPKMPEDVPAAEQATDYINYILQQDNPGFTIMYSTFKDSLVRKCGIVKAWYQDTTTTRTEHYTGLDEQTMQIVSQEEDTDVMVVSQYEDSNADPMPQMDPQTGQPQVDPMTGQMMMAPPPMLFDVDIKRTIRDGKINVQGVPPEEFLLDRNARSLADAAFVGHRQMMSVADLLGMGYEDDEIEEHISSSEFDANDEYLRRRPTTTTIGSINESSNPAMKRVLYLEAWMRVDFDGDGIPELRKFCCMGSGYKIMRNEPTDFMPFALFPCDPEPHTSPLEANSIFDYTKDLQEIKSDILRNTLDSLAQAIHPRTAVVEGQVNIDDVLNNETGAIIRMRAPGMVQPLAMPFVGQAAFPMLEYVDAIKENRTGMSKASMGLDADSLQSSTRAAVSATISASQSRLELTTRVLAEGMKDMFKLLLKLSVAHQDKARMVRLRNQWVQVDPRTWDAGMDVTINTALGTGDTQEKLGMLQAILAQQQQALTQMGPTNPLASMSQMSNTLRKMVEMAGFKDSSQFFNAVPANWQPPQQQPKPTPEEMLAQVQAQSIQADIQKKAAELQLKREDMMRSDDRQRDKMDIDKFIALRELELKYGIKMNEVQLNAEINRNRDMLQQQPMQQPMQQPQGGMNG